MSATRGSPQLRGILCMVAGVTVILGNDAAIKWLSEDYPIHQLVLLRSLIAIPITLAILRFEGGWRALRTPHPWLHTCRGMLIVIANMTFFLGLAALPIADAMVLFFVAPLFITALSAPLLGERVGWRRWLAVLLGMVGVIVMQRPGSGVYQWAALLPAVAAACYALMQVMTRRLGANERAAPMALYLHLAFLAVSALSGMALGDGRFAGTGDPSLEFMLRAWQWPQQDHLGAMLLTGVCVGVGGYLLTQAYRLARVGVVAPFEYMALPWGLLAGFLIWGDIPDIFSVLGMLLIIGSGLFVWFRENQFRVSPG
ncbi:MAG: DMT family transporter [Gammaproteobacteria bacterium]|nr:DMT family transporter [Gammaproteobacteria bacterium]